MDTLPRFQDLVTPLLEYLKKQAGPVNNSQINQAVAESLGIPEHLLTKIHSGTRTEFQYRMAWARTKAKVEGKISSPKREYWVLES